MRAVRFASFGDPAKVLQVEDLPLTAPGPGQVLLRMLVRPINPSDLFTIRGQYGRLPRLPATPGMEGAGRIESLGPGVRGFAVGQLVVPLGVGGTWQEYLVANASALIPMPEGLSERDAAMLVVNPTSAWLLLHEVLRVAPGAWLIQNAANSAVGRFIIRLARRSGVHTINIVRRPNLRDELLAEGADVVLYENDPDLLDQIARTVGAHGVGYALDSVAGASGSRLVQTLRPGGQMVVFGAISRQPLTIDPSALIFRNISLHGWWLAQWFQTASPTHIADLMATLQPLVADGTLRAPIAAEYNLEEVQQAVAAAEQSERNGKILLVG
ncbi:zinc-dependent alcohol dehydrogenase family protein [Candidatus Oscillochloris fontis]|uniref:zinc-dependent alcohol dehydrogenase family protein n=1 Tax=Candidatus Oscillochloris fontis TaxID=2496868 RepID=UPI00101C5131|nr:zinc-dependent alcohol dehydrogenase family protein [Candidatus Oscillochloris fontis]